MKATAELPVVNRCKQISVVPTNPLQWRCVTSIAVLLSLFIAAQNAAATTFQWVGGTNGDFDNRLNWNPNGVPGSGDTADFGNSSAVNVFTSTNTAVGVIVYSTAASAYTTTVPGGLTFTIDGTGIANSSVNIQNIVAQPGTAAGGKIALTNSTIVGSKVTLTASGAPFSGGFAGDIDLSGTANGGSGTFRADPGLGGSGGAGRIRLFDSSDLGKARVEVFSAVGESPGTLDVSGDTNNIINIGSVEGNGDVFGGGKNLMIGSNNKSTTFSGVIADGGQSGGTGASVTKVGKGIFLFTSASGYTGGLTLLNGQVLIKNKKGSATGSGPVNVLGGTFGGDGEVNGAVSVGSATTTTAATLLPGFLKTPRDLIVNNTVTIYPPGIFEVGLFRGATPATSELTAMGVTIQKGATFKFFDTGNGTIASHTVFVIINNTSVNPIFGTFGNLPDKSKFTSNGTTLDVNYEGGSNGKSLTFTAE